MNKHSFAWCCILAALLGGTVLAHAQTPPASPAPTPRPTRVERSIYVPYEQLEQVFGKEQQGVFLPYREFLEFWNKVDLPEAIRKKTPPVNGVLASATYSGKVEGDTATVTAQFQLEALKEGWSILQLGAAGMALSSVNGTATLTRTPEGYGVVFPDKGKYNLQATLYGKITRDTGANLLEFSLPRTAASRFELLIPEKGLEFTVTPACAFTSTETAEGTRFAAFFGAAEEVKIRWVRKGAETGLRPLLFVESQTTSSITAGALRTTVDLQYRILRAGVQKLEVEIPAGQQVLSAEGANLKEWTVEEQGGTQVVRVTLQSSVRDRYSLKLSLESAVGSLPTNVTIPVVRARETERQSGTLSLFGDPDLTLEPAKLEGLTQQAAPSSGKRPTFSYRYSRMPWALDVKVAAAAPEFDAESQTLLVVEQEQLLLRSRILLHVRRAGLFGLRIGIPAAFKNTETSGPIVESSDVHVEGGMKFLDVKFNARQTGDCEFLIYADVPRAKPDEPAEAPVLRISDARRHEGRIGVAVHVGLKANTADLGGLHQEDVANLSLPRAKNPSATPLILGYRFRGEASPAKIEFELRKPRVSAQVLALMEARESVLRISWQVQYAIEYAGVDTFEFDMPSDIAGDIQIEGESIKERARIDLTNKAGQRTGRSTWRVTLQDKKLGKHALSITLERPRGQVAPGQKTRVALPDLRPLDLFRETGQVAVLKDGNLEFTATDAKGLETIDPKELDGALQKSGVFLAYKYSARPISLDIEVAKNLFLEVPSAIVTHAVLQSVIADDRAQTTEVIYWVRNNSRQFIAVKLPEGGRLLSDVFVDGEAQQPSRRPDRNEILIRLPIRSGKAAPAAVRFVYEIPSPKPGKTMGWMGSINIAPLALSETDVLQTQWTLYLPQNYRYIRFSGPMKATEGRRGWDAFRRRFQNFIPSIGPYVPITDPQWQTPPTPPVQHASGFDFQVPKEGVPITLRRLDAPASATVVYRSKGFAGTIEAALLLAAFVLAVMIRNASRELKFLYFAAVGLGSLVMAGAVAPYSAGAWHAIYLGVFFGALLWLILGAFNWVINTLRAIGRWQAARAERREAARRAHTPPPMPPVPPPATPTDGPQPTA